MGPTNIQHIYCVHVEVHVTMAFLVVSCHQLPNVSGCILLMTCDADALPSSVYWPDCTQRAIITIADSVVKCNLGSISKSSFESVKVGAHAAAETDAALCGDDTNAEAVAVSSALAISRTFAEAFLGSIVDCYAGVFHFLPRADNNLIACCSEHISTAY